MPRVFKKVAVFTKVPGAVVRLGTWGEASNEVPAWVPEDVAIDLETRLGDEYRVERDAGEVPANARIGESASRKGQGVRARKE